MTKAKLTAIRLTVEALAVLLIAIFLVTRYEAQITAVNWKLVSIVVVAAIALFGLYRWQMQEANPYDVRDMVMADGRADLDAHLKIASFFLAVWVIVQQALASKEVTALVLGVLGFFVAGKAAKGFSDALQNRPPAADPSQININAAPAAKPAAPAPTLPASGDVKPLPDKIGASDVGMRPALVRGKPKRRK